MAHFSFSEVANWAVKNRWGSSKQSIESATQELSCKTMADAAMLALVGSLREWARSILNDEKEQKRELGEPPKDAKRFPNAKQGDLLYSGELAEGVDEYVVLGVTNEGFALLCGTGAWEGQTEQRRVYWAGDDHFETLAAAVENAARSDIKYYGKGYEFAQKALAAVEANEDLSPFLEGWEVEEEPCA